MSAKEPWKMTVSEAVFRYKQMEKMMPDSGMIREVKYQYADMSRGGDGGELGFPDRTVTCRSHNYKDYPDSFFQEVCDLMGWDR